MIEGVQTEMTIHALPTNISAQSFKGVVGREIASLRIECGEYGYENGSFDLNFNFDVDRNDVIGVAEMLERAARNLRGIVGDHVATVLVTPDEYHALLNVASFQGSSSDYIASNRALATVEDENPGYAR
jgi:hypothetical protein